MQILSLSTLIGAAFCFTAFWMKSLNAFLALFSVGELVVFIPQVFVRKKSLLGRRLLFFDRHFNFIAGSC